MAEHEEEKKNPSEVLREILNERGQLTPEIESHLDLFRDYLNEPMMNQQIEYVHIKLDSRFPPDVKITDQLGREIRAFWPIDIHLDGDDAMVTLRLPIEQIDIIAEPRVVAVPEEKLGESKMSVYGFINLVRDAVSKKREEKL